MLRLDASLYRHRSLRQGTQCEMGPFDEADYYNTGARTGHALAKLAFVVVLMLLLLLVLLLLVLAVVLAHHR